MPLTGDIIFFDWENAGVSDHVGIVERVDNNTIYTIKGNFIYE
ncbi:CHAP domain-containing protein [Eubacterium sp. TF05-29]|nr:CHAP domain-containing protein [Eubacterium sp. AF18-3]RJW05696.1 CHAP domain-containing protein [Eubacterium sp. AM28-8LB]RJW16103.1 CHAP domain-containing protein [Eubacterium sp. TF12-12]RJW23221.1 CHAP domain-containing protein [Eubacterium sp. TF05-29]